MASTLSGLPTATPYSHSVLSVHDASGYSAALNLLGESNRKFELKSFTVTHCWLAVCPLNQEPASLPAQTPVNDPTSVGPKLLDLSFPEDLSRAWSNSLSDAIAALSYNILPLDCWSMNKRTPRPKELERHILDLGTILLPPFGESKLAAVVCCCQR